jgi:hypothetical protein
MPVDKNRGPLLVDKFKGYLDRLPDWLKGSITLRVEKQKVDALSAKLDSGALESKLTHEVTDEKLKSSTWLGDGEPGSGNDTSQLPTSHVSQVVITQTGQVATVTETVDDAALPLVEGPPLVDGASEQLGDVFFQKKVEAPPFDNQAYQVTREDVLPAEFRALVPERSEKHTVTGTAAMPTLVSGDLARGEEQTKVGVKEVTARSRDMSTPPVLSGQKIDPEWNGAVLSLEQKIVPASTTLTAAFGTTDASVKPVDGINALQETWKQATATFPKITLRAYDTEMQSEVLTDITIVGQGGPYSPTNLTLDYDERKIDAVHSTRIVNRTANIPPGYSTYETQMITYPAILSSISFGLLALAATNRKEPQWVVGVRSAFTSATLVWTDINFFTSEPAPDPLFTWKPTDILYKGASFSMSISNVLCDTWTNIGVSYTSDAYYGNLIDRFSISETEPSATTYAGAIGTWQTVGSSVTRYKRFWVKKTVQIVLQ